MYVNGMELLADNVVIREAAEGGLDLDCMGSSGAAASLTVTGTGCVCKVAWM